MGLMENSRDKPPDWTDRESICIGCPALKEVLHSGQVGFADEVEQHIDKAEHRAGAMFYEMKGRLKKASTHDFWKILTEEMTDISGAQYAFVSKRVLPNDENAAVEMPPYGEPGSCLMGVGFHFNDRNGTVQNISNFNYQVYGCPCRWMRHDKVFLVPEKLIELTPNNPNPLPIAPDAYIAVPLFSEGKCFAHFGLMWTPEGSKQRVLSWGYLELFLHALEDQVLLRLLEGQSFAAQEDASPPKPPGPVIAHQDIGDTRKTWLEPYARSLSHELRTPMHGVVGMLDVMYASVQEAAEIETNSNVLSVFKNLKENIEVVQGRLNLSFALRIIPVTDSPTDSSRRAVEAADNVVHAYAMNMQVPETPAQGVNGEGPDGGFPFPDIGSNRIPKRRRSHSNEWSMDSPPKRTRASEFILNNNSLYSEEISPGTLPAGPAPSSSRGRTPPDSARPRQTPPPGTPQIIDLDGPSTRTTDLRQLFQLTINESLRVGGRPDSAVALPTDVGENIDVRWRTSNGEARSTTVSWSVDPMVPDILHSTLSFC